jgi:hypothetical protein
MQDGLWHTSGMKKAQNFVESYFHWCGREVAVVHEESPFGDLRVNLEEREVIWWHTLLKVISCATLIIPTILFIARTILRLRCTLVINFQTKSFAQSQETGRFHPVHPKILCEGVKRNEWGRVDTIKSREADFSWTGSQVHPNGDQEIGYFSSVSSLITGTKITGTSIAYIHTDPLTYVIRDNKKIAFARVWLGPDNCQIRAIQQTIWDSYEPYSGTVYEALALTASTYYDQEKFAIVLQHLTDRDYFDPKTFFTFLTTPDAKGALPALELSSGALEVLINYYKDAVSSLDVAATGRSGESLFSFWMGWGELSIVNLLLKYCYLACMGQIEERAITFFAMPIDPLAPPVKKIQAFIAREREKEEHPIIERLILAIQNEETDPPPCYNLANLLGTIELTNKEKRLALHCVPRPTLLKLCELYSQGKVVFERPGVTKAQFLTLVDPTSKENLLTLWTKKGDGAVLRALLNLDSTAIKLQPQIHYFAIAVDSGRTTAAEVLLAEMQKQNIPLSPIEVWFKKIKETTTPLQMTLAEKELFTKAELAMLLRAGRLYKQTAFVTQLRDVYNVANSDFLPTVIIQKVLSFVGYSGARVSYQFRVWTYTGATKEIAENVMARLLPNEVFTTIFPALSKLGVKFYRSYLKAFYHHNHNPHVFFAQLESIRDRFLSQAKKDPEFTASAQLLATITEELPKRVKDLKKRADAIVEVPEEILRDDYVEYLLDAIEEQVNVPYSYAPGKWLSYEGRMARVETALKSYAQFEKTLADL